MKRYAQPILWFTLTLFLLTTLAGTGTAVAETGSGVDSSSALSSCTYNTSEAKIGRAPAQLSNLEELVNGTQYGEFTHIASGDWLAIQFSKSNASDCTYNEPAGSNIAYATPATPEANTSHTVVPETNRSISGLREISIEYEIPPQLNNGFNRSNISLFGVDVNKDGFIEKSLNDSIEYISVPRSNTIQISLNGNTTIPSDSYFVLRYNGISNPKYNDKNVVNTTIVGNQTTFDEGIIQYKSNLTGLVGHGAQLSITRENSQLVTLRQSETVITNDSVYVFLPTQPNVDNEREYSLTIIDEQQSNVSTSNYTRNVLSNYTVFGRFAYVFSNPEIKNGTIYVRGYTNIAPGSEIYIQVYDRGRLIEKRTVTDSSRSLNVSIPLPDELAKSRALFINVLDHDRTSLGRGIFTRQRLAPDSFNPRP